MLTTFSRPTFPVALSKRGASTLHFVPDFMLVSCLVFQTSWVRPSHSPRLLRLQRYCLLTCDLRAWNPKLFTEVSQLWCRSHSCCGNLFLVVGMHHSRLKLLPRLHCQHGRLLAPFNSMWYINRFWTPQRAALDRKTRVPDSFPSSSSLVSLLDGSPPSPPPNLSPRLLFHHHPEARFLQFYILVDRRSRFTVTIPGYR